ncbi:MAG: MFS transporter [Gemmatimonadetes bacterium]|nr:MFS transporter [Gemmatimonadota bacterium]
MNRKHIVSWALYDFAGSIYSSVVATAVFPVFFVGAIVGNETGRGDQLWGWVASLSVFIVALSSPLIGAVADRAGVRRQLLILYTLLGVGAVTAFVSLSAGMVWTAFALAVVANVGFEGGQVFYNAYLPDIAPKTHQGRISGLGFGLGYAGSAVGLIAAIPLARSGRLDLLWLMVGGWWLLFSLPAFLFLPPTPGLGESVGRAAVNGVIHFRRIVREVLAQAQMRRFLLAYFFYIDGVNTVITMSALFATGTLGFTPAEVIKVFLVVQFAALLGSFALAKPTDVWGPKRVILATLVLWSAVAVSAMFVTSKGVFFGVAVCAGLGLGSIQAASRSFMSALIPEGKEAEMFGFYSFCGKTSSIMGPLVFGYVSVHTGGNQRVAVLAIAIFFVVGGLLLRRVADPLADDAVAERAVAGAGV